jgi:hypothetical protein
MTKYQHVFFLLVTAALPLTASAQPAAPVGGRDASITVDFDKPVHTMRGGIGASWHAIGPTPFYYSDLISRDNRNCRGSGFGGNPPLSPKYETAWKDLLHHARWLGLDFIRVEIDMRMYNPQRGVFTWDNEEMQTLDRILQFCQTNQVDVYFTMMWQDVEWNAFPGVCRLQSAPRSVEDFAESYSTLLARLVKTNGFTCIHWVTVNNEPGMKAGWWQKADRSPDSIMPAVRAVRAALDQRGLKDVAVCGSDGHGLNRGECEPNNSAVGALSVHNYAGVSKFADCIKIARERDIPFFVSEFGRFFMAKFEGDNMALGGPRSEAPKSYSAQLLNAEKVLVGLNAGVDGFNRWSFVNRGDLDGQWQMVRTWNPNLWDFYKNVTAEPVPYFSYGILTRFTAKHSTVMLASSDDPEVIAAALRSPKGQTTIFILNKSDKERKATLQIAGLKDNLSLRQYQVTEAELLKPSFALTALATVNANTETNHLTITLPGKSITAYTTFQLADDADGITQE